MVVVLGTVVGGTVVVVVGTAVVVVTGAVVVVVVSSAHAPAVERPVMIEAEAITIERRGKPVSLRMHGGSLGIRPDPERDRVGIHPPWQARNCDFSPKVTVFGSIAPGWADVDLQRATASWGSRR